MSFIRTPVLFSHKIYRTVPTKDSNKLLAAFVSNLTGKQVTSDTIRDLPKEHLDGCKAAEAVPQGQKILPNGRVSLKNTFYGRGYTDQHRSRVSGQTIHELHESLRRVSEPLEGFKRTSPLYLAQIQDPRSSLRRFLICGFFGLVLGFGWAILYRINDNAMFAEWDRTYRLHLSYSQAYEQELAEKRKEENIEFDTTPRFTGESILLSPKSF